MGEHVTVFQTTWMPGGIEQFKSRLNRLRPRRARKPQAIVLPGGEFCVTKWGNRGTNKYTVFIGPDTYPDASVHSKYRHRSINFERVPRDLQTLALSCLGEYGKWLRLAHDTRVTQAKAVASNSVIVTAAGGHHASL